MHEKRGLEAMTAIGIIPRYGGVIVHDCWASYLSYEHCRHGLCGAHLLRELTFIREANGYAWPATCSGFCSRPAPVSPSASANGLPRASTRPCRNTTATSSLVGSGDPAHPGKQNGKPGSGRQIRCP
ncbi:MAG: transposase [Proteobacteria bacterium]|nr:transposase [Pseudomonadota bacterium]